MLDIYLLLRYVLKKPVIWVASILPQPSQVHIPNNRDFKVILLSNRKPYTFSRSKTELKVHGSDNTWVVPIEEIYKFPESVGIYGHPTIGKFIFKKN